MNDGQPLIPTTLWLALFPLTYLVHFAEEYWGGEGYPAYLMRIRGVELTTARFVTLEIVGFVLLVIGVVLARQLRFPEFMIVLLGAVTLANGISHSATALWAGGYGPGLITSAFVWFPLGAFTLIMMFGRMTNTRFALASLIGIGINVVVGLIALRGGKVDLDLQ